MKILLLVFCLLFSAIYPVESSGAPEIEYFVITIGEIYPGKGIECAKVWDFNRQKDVVGLHFVRIDTTQYEFYDGQQVSVTVVSDGVLKSADGSRTAKAWNLVPGKVVKLH